MSLIKQLKQAIEAYGNSHNGTTRNTIKNAIIVLTRRNKQWDEHFLNELIKLNDSSIFEAINVYDFIDYAYAHKKLPHLFKSLKIACRSSFNSFFGVLSLVNKIQVIKQKQEHKSARSSDNKNLSLSEAKLESGCEHILFDDRSGVIYLITETLDKYHETPLTTHEHNLIRQVLTIKDTPTIESQKVLPFLIRALERRLSAPILDLLIHTHEVRQQWGVRLDRITPPSQLPATTLDLFKQYYINLIKTLTPQDKPTSYQSRREIFFQIKLFHSSTSFIDDLFRHQEDLATFFSEMSFSDLYQFIHTNIIPSRINDSNRNSVLLSLNNVFNSLKTQSTERLFEFIYITVHLLKTVPDSIDNPHQSVKNQLINNIQDWIEINLFASSNKVQKEILCQKTLLYAVLMHEQESKSLIPRLLEQKNNDRACIDLKENVFWCFGGDESPASQFLRDCGIKNTTTFALLYHSDIIKTATFINTAAIASLHVAPGYTKHHPLVELIDLKHRHTPSKNDRDNVIHCIKQCRELVKRPLDRDLLSKIVIRIIAPFEDDEAHIRYLIGDSITGANPNYILSEKEYENCFLSDPAISSKLKWRKEFTTTLTEFPLLTMIYLMRYTFKGTLYEHYKAATTALIHNGGSYLSHDGQKPSVLELYWDAINPYKLGKENPEDKRGWIEEYYQWIKKLPQRDREHTKKALESGLIIKLRKYHGYLKYCNYDTKDAKALISDTIDHLCFELNVTLNLSHHDSEYNQSITLLLLSMVKKQLAEKLLHENSAHQAGIIKQLAQKDELDSAIKNSANGVDSVLVQIDSKRLKFSHDVLKHILFDHVMSHSSWIQNLQRLTLLRKELTHGSIALRARNYSHIQDAFSQFFTFSIDEKVSLTFSAVARANEFLLRLLINSAYENKHKEVYGDTQSDSAFLFSLIINTFVVTTKNWGEVKNTPSDIKRHEKILDMLIEHIKEDDPIIPLLIHYTALVLTHASKENKKDDRELFWRGSHTLDALISSLKHHHITTSSPADIVTLFKNLRKPPLSIDLTHKLQSIITNKNINIESRRMCFNYAIEILKSTPPNHAIQLETLLSHKQQQLLFNVKPNRWGSAQVDLLLTYFKTNFQANAKTVIRYILSCNPPHTSPKLSQLIETLLYWSKFRSTITKLSKEEIASLHYLIKLMPEENLIELFDTHLGHLLLINHFDDLFTHLTDKPYGLYLLKRIITAVSKTKITIPEKNLTRIALYIMQGHDLVSLKLLLSHRKFNLSTKAKITVARDLMSFRPTNMQADEITTTLFKFAYFSGRSNDVLRIVSQHTQLSPAEEKAFLSELQEAYTTNTYYSNTYFSLMTIVLDPFHNIIPPAHSEEVTDSELKQYFMSLSDSPLCGDIILLILSFLCPSASMLQATESHCNRIVQNQTFSGEKEKDKMKLLTLFMSTFHSSHWKKRRQKPLNCEEKNLHTFWLSKDKKLCTKEPIHTTLPLSGNNLIHVLTYRRKNLSQHPLVNKAIDRLSQLSFEKKSDFANEQRIKSMLVAFDALESFINRVGYIKALDHEDNGSYIKHQAIVEEVVNCIEDLERISIDKRTQKKDALANLFESIWNGEHHEHQPAFVTEVFV